MSRRRENIITESEGVDKYGFGNYGFGPKYKPVVIVFYSFVYVT
jgi:hypothetical protein